MKYLNHITMNSGHIRKTYPNEVNKVIFFILKRIYKDSLKPNGAEVFDGFTAKSTKTEIGTLTTLYNTEKLPILTVGCSKNDNGGELWRMMHETATSPLATKKSDPPPLPYIADRLEFGAVMDPSSMTWTADFSRCMGWIILAPLKIR